MATFSVREVEGMRQVRVDLAGEAIRTRRGAMSNLRGAVRATARLPGPGDLLRGAVSGEARVRPRYAGTGTVVLQPSLGGYHVLDVEEGEDWILEPGVFWAAEEGVRLGLFRERISASLWAGDGWLVWKTTLAGAGRVAINAPGPVETVDVEDALRVQGRLVLGRTRGLRFSSERAGSVWAAPLLGQKRLRAFRGRGRALVCWTPYWNQHMYEMMTGGGISRSLFE